MSDSEIADKLTELKIFKNQKKQFLITLVKIYRDRAKKFTDFKTYSTYIFKLPDYKKELLIFKKSNLENTIKGLKATIESLEKLDNKKWKLDKINQALSDVVKKDNLSNGDVFWPTRVSLSGLEASPSPAELMEVLDKKESIKRIKEGLDKL